MQTFKPEDQFDYPFSNRFVPYRTENIEISPDEMKKIKNIQPKPSAIHVGEVNDGNINILIDTDLGTDFDDSLALLYALRIPHCNIVGITTNYGPTDIRANDIKKIVEAHFKLHPSYPKFPVIAGASRPLGTHREMFLAGNEGYPFLTKEQIRESINLENINKRVQNTAAAYIAYAAMQYPNLTIISIGIPTNIGIALTKFPEIKEMVQCIVCMGCGKEITLKERFKFTKHSYKPKEWSNLKQIQPPFDVPESQDVLKEWVQNGKIIHLFPNHNISGDVVASKIMFDSGIPIKIVSHSVTSKFWFNGEGITHLRKQAESLTADQKAFPVLPSQAVGELMLEWFKVRMNNNGNGQCPHDPLTINEALFGGDESHVLYVNGTLIMHEWAAFSTFVPHPDGKHQLGIDIQRGEAFLEKLTRAVLEED